MAQQPEEQQREEAASGSLQRERDELRERVQRLTGEVETAHAKLGALHASDANALRRAYTSLSQHVCALEQVRVCVRGACHCARCPGLPRR